MIGLIAPDFSYIHPFVIAFVGREACMVIGDDPFRIVVTGNHSLVIRDIESRTVEESPERASDQFKDSSHPLLRRVALLAIVLSAADIPLNDGMASAGPIMSLVTR